MKYLFLLTMAVFVLPSCSEKEPAVTSLKKDHSVEILLESKRLADSTVLLITHQNVFVKGKLVKTILHTDTLPAPGDSLQNVEVDGIDKWVRLPKEFEFFVTIK
jgi:hypothetical protein